MSGTRRIVFLVDGTGSMGSYLTALTQEVFPQTTKMVRLLSGTSEIQLDAIIYRDYCDANTIESCIGKSTQELSEFLSRQRPSGGGDLPEAHKTGLNVLLESCQKGDQVLVLHYTDAPPHHEKTGSQAANINAERQALKDKTPGFDWINISKQLSDWSIPVFTFIEQSRPYAPFYAVCGHGGGDVVIMPNVSPNTIVQATVGVLVQIMGEPFAFTDNFSIQRVTNDEKIFVGDENSPQTIYTRGTQFIEMTKLTFDNIRLVDWLESDLKSLPDRALKDPDFRDLCFTVMKELFCPSMILCMTYNEVLGKVWRILCRFRDDSRIETLRNALSSCVTSLSGENQKQLQAWIEKSYNYIEEIHNSIMAIPEEKRYPFLLLDGATIDITRKEILTLSTSPSPGVLYQVQRLLCSVILVETNSMPRDSNDYFVGIPLEFPDKEIFSLLCHLIFPGVRFTLKPSLIVAIVAYLGGNAILKDRAESLLLNKKGKWLGLPTGCNEVPLPQDAITKFEQAPELLSVEYCKLLCKVPQFLTEEENQFYGKMFKLWRLRSAAKKKISLRLPYTPNKDLLPDVKAKCSKCNHLRSETLLVDGVCGLCLTCTEKEEPESTDENQSTMVECRTCSAIYAVIHVNDLNVQAKCHYCREGLRVPTVTCSECQNDFLNLKDKPNTWKCAVCTTQPRNSFKEQDVHLIALLAGNPTLRKAIGFTDELFELLFGWELSKSNGLKNFPLQNLQLQSFFKLYTKYSNILVIIEPSDLTVDSLVVGGKQVKGSNEKVQEIMDIISGGDLTDDCVLCFQTVGVNQLSSACGSCNNDICKSCAEQWWSSLAPGKLVLPTHLYCPFCRQMPTAKVLRSYNKQLCCMARRKQLQVEGKEWYGWCLQCYQVKAALKRECSSAAPELKEFVCEECVASREIAMEHASGKCPSCNAPTEKIGGCDHMTCICGAHWCFVCGEEFDAEEIYEHMYDAHGGIGL